MLEFKTEHGNSKTVIDDNSIYKLTEVKGRRVKFSHTTYEPNVKCYNLREDKTINLDTKEVCCNVTWSKTLDDRSYSNLVGRIEEIFKLDSLLDFIQE